MQQTLIDLVIEEEEIALAKWGAKDRTSQDLLCASLEELGEVAHAINHNEDSGQILQEIIETIGILSRLYNMLTSR